ncbi:unnamed protein product, partial [Closterium sp. NIES-65]
TILLLSCLDTGLDNNQLTGELPSFHHMPNLTEPYSLHVHNNYFTTTPDPSDTHMLCLLHHNCLHGSTTDCTSWQDQRRASECRAFCGAQPLTPPCSGHGVCFIEPDSSRDMTACYDDVYDPPPPYCTPEGQCVCDEGYTPGTKAGTCVPHVPAVVGMAPFALQMPGNLLLLLLLLLPLAVLVLLAFSLPQLLRRLKNRPPTRYFFSKRALAARQAAMGVEITR